MSEPQLNVDVPNEAGWPMKSVRSRCSLISRGTAPGQLTRGVDANGELHPPQSEAPHLYKTSPLGWIPKDWDV